MARVTVAVRCGRSYPHAYNGARKVAVEHGHAARARSRTGIAGRCHAHTSPASAAPPVSDFSWLPPSA